ncbi:MAG TPA: hypothetical protein VH482_23835 [Thermomicrobiales bacterium]
MNGWWLGSGLGILYLVLLATLGWYTWSKGHKGWFFVGLIFPPCWLVGALLKPERGSSYERQQREHWSQHGD